MKRLLFVCTENSGRSQIAEAFARIHNTAGLEIWSAGSKPSGKVNSLAIKSMQEVGYDLTKHDSKSLNDIPKVTFDIVITMGCGETCPFVSAKQREDWDIPDPKNYSLEQFREIRNLIESKVKNLLSQINV
ncbi:MAG: Glutaredoxin arsenate reductase [Dehalococcoidia bacterium]|nr:Glutaredoxin arsenate reductase [Chloroflexota bacterium]MBT9161545.1 Glutaredoxin arsenate reductase [Chloroflexota bacterium]